ncbi:MAG TPA: TauD/TfdA family dioxygenase [Gammaproteobacteria bacterium]
MFKPFNLEDEQDYLRWREWKLEKYPERLDDLVVEVNDPKMLTAAESEAILSLCQKTNMAIYASNNVQEDKAIPRCLGAQFGLNRLNHNWLADDDAITSLAVNNQGEHPHYIPYTNRPISWHTDGYYNRKDEQIWGLLLHCVRPASRGGENQILDHEIAYIKLRDTSPDYIRALMQPDVMTIPARTDTDGSVARQVEAGPVFSVNEVTGDLHMRYTARTRNIVWKDDKLACEAINHLESLLKTDMPYKFVGRLEPGMGLVSNNVLHDRSGFDETKGQERLLYRARYFDRIRKTSIRELFP